MSRFNKKAVGIKTTNLAGGRAYSFDKETELIHAVLTTFLEPKYYESDATRITRIQELVKINDPLFVAQLAFVARTEFNLRSVSHLLLGELSKVHSGDDIVRTAIEKTVIRVDDMTEIASYLNGKLPKQVKRGLRRALFKFNRYQLAKYKGEGKGLKLVDLFNLIHPNPKYANEEQKQAWSDLMTGKLKSFDTWEVEVSANPSKETWERLINENKLGYMALLRNLNNLIKYGVSDEVITKVVNKLTNVEQVANSKQLPFRFTTAYQNVQGNRVLTDAISEAMDIAVSNTPTLSGRTLIAIDGSGSMQGKPMDIASIFGATLAKANRNADVILYDTQVKELNLSTRIPVVDLANIIKNGANGGGTMTALVFAYAEQKGVKYDRVIIISDNESWSESYHNSSVQAQYEHYKKALDGDPFVYAIDIQGYGTKDITGGRVKHLAGWSDRLLDFIERIEEGNTLVDYIKSIEV